VGVVSPSFRKGLPSDLHRENVGAFLSEEAGGFVFFLCLLESFTSFLFFLDFGNDRAVADGHRHSVDGSFGRGREDVGGIDGLVAMVGVSLGELNLGDGAANGDLGVRRLQREGVDLMIAVNFKVRRLLGALSEGDESGECEEER